jgi:5-formyltetrahydrofolate cyclo-ligase
MDKNKIRKKIWKELIKVAKPDSRFHLNFEEYIPDFAESENAHRLIYEDDIYKNSDFIFITPDNCLEKIREQSLLDNKTIIVSTYGIYRGFVMLSNKNVPKGSEKFASTLDGMELFGKNISLKSINKKFNLLITGASAVSNNGVRFGKGHGFFDLEWGMFYDMKYVDEETQVYAVIHEVQKVNFDLEPSVTDILVDKIYTNINKYKTERKIKRPEGIFWDKLEPGMLENTPPLQELKKILG